MNLASAINHLKADPGLSALGHIHNGRPHYAALVRTEKGLVFECPALVTTLRVPFDLRGVDDSTRELIALAAKSVDWTLFRDGVPMEEGEPSPRRRRQPKS